MLFPSPLHSLELRQIEQFCLHWPEGVRVEYKRELDARHIPKVVSSFANTVGGVWIIGVATDVENRAVFPIRGISRTPGIEERITQSCYHNLYPPLLPDIKIIDVPGEGGRVVVVVQISESVEAPHAIENSTKVYIRTNSPTEIIQMAEIDRIEYLLKRRQQPEQMREDMIHSMATRSPIGSPFLRVVVSPRYPSRPIFPEDDLKTRLQNVVQAGTYSSIGGRFRLVRQGFMSLVPTVSSHSPDFHVEINVYGVLSCYVPLAIEEGKRVHLDQIVTEIGRALNLAEYLLKDTTQNLLVRVSLQGVGGCLMVVSGGQGAWTAIEEFIQGEHYFASESLGDDLLFANHVAELTRQMMWSFNWAEREKINQMTREILTRYKIP
jgi:schlafen family protein